MPPKIKPPFIIGNTIGLLLNSSIDIELAIEKTAFSTWFLSNNNSALSSIFLASVDVIVFVAMICLKLCCPMQIMIK